MTRRDIMKIDDYRKHIDNVKCSSNFRAGTEKLLSSPPVRENCHTGKAILHRRKFVRPAAAVFAAVILTGSGMFAYARMQREQPPKYEDAVYHEDEPVVSKEDINSVSSFIKRNYKDASDSKYCTFYQDKDRSIIFELSEDSRFLEMLLESSWTKAEYGSFVYNDFCRIGDIYYNTAGYITSVSGSVIWKTDEAGCKNLNSFLEQQINSDPVSALGYKVMKQENSLSIAGSFEAEYLVSRIEDGSFSEYTVNAKGGLISDSSGGYIIRTNEASSSGNDISAGCISRNGICVYYESGSNIGKLCDTRYMPLIDGVPYSWEYYGIIPDYLGLTPYSQDKYYLDYFKLDDYFLELLADYISPDMSDREFETAEDGTAVFRWESSLSGGQAEVRILTDSEGHILFYEETLNGKKMCSFRTDDLHSAQTGTQLTGLENVMLRMTAEELSDSEAVYVSYTGDMASSERHRSSGNNALQARQLLDEASSYPAENTDDMSGLYGIRFTFMDNGSLKEYILASDDTLHFSGMTISGIPENITGQLREISSAAAQQ